MPQLSRRHIPDKTKALLDDALISVFVGLKRHEASKILSALLTKTERIMLAKRLGIAYLLCQDVTEVAIAETVKITRQTVARIRLQLQVVPQEACDYLFTKLSSWKRTVDFKAILKEAAAKVTATLIKGARFG